MLYQYLQLRNWFDMMTKEEGQDLVEYALLLGLITLVSIVALTTAGQSVSSIWSTIAARLQSAVGTAVP